MDFVISSLNPLICWIN